LNGFSKWSAKLKENVEALQYFNVNKKPPSHRRLEGFLFEVGYYGIYATA